MKYFLLSFTNFHKNISFSETYPVLQTVLGPLNTYFLVRSIYIEKINWLTYIISQIHIVVFLIFFYFELNSRLGSWLDRAPSALKDAQTPNLFLLFSPSSSVSLLSPPVMTFPIPRRPSRPRRPLYTYWLTFFFFFLLAACYIE